MLLLKMRTGIFSYIFLAFLVLGGIGLVLSSGQGSFSPSGLGSSDVAVVDGKPISSVEFDKLVRRILRSQKLTPEIALKSGMIDQILEVTLIDHLFKKAAYDYGVVVDDKHVANQVNDLLTPMVEKDGDRKKVLAQILQSQGMSEADLVDNLRAEISTRVMRTAVTGNYYVPSAVAKDLYQHQNERRTIEGVMILEEAATTIKAPSDADLQIFFDKIQNRYTDPETRSFTVGIVSPDSFAATTKITDEQVKAYYDEHKDSYQVGEQRILEQVVLESEDKAKAVLKASAQTSLSKAVKSVTGTTKAYTAATGFEKNGLPAELGTAIFSAKDNTYVGPLKSPLGWHVVFVKSIEAPKIQPFDEVSASIRKDLMDNAKGDQTYKAIAALEERLNQGEKLEDVAKDTGMKLVTVKNINMAMPEIAALKNYANDEHKILQLAFSMQNGETSPLTDMNDGKLFALHVDSVKPKRQKDLKEVKGEIAALWMHDQRQKANAAYAEKMMTALDAKKATLAEVAKEKNSKVQTISGLNRDGKPPAGLTEGNLRQIMSAKKGTYIVMPADKGIMLAHITDIKTEAKTADPKTVTVLQEKTGSDASQENLLLFVDDLKVKYDTRVNRAVIERMYGDKDTQ